MKKGIVMDRISVDDFELKIEYKKEIIKTINKYRRKGATYHEIAVILNRAGCETFTGKGEWHAQSIFRKFTDSKNKGNK